MAYGSRDKNPFSPPQLKGTKYYLLVESDGQNKGQITIKSPTLLGATFGANSDRTVGVIPLDNSFRPEPGSTTSDELKYFSSASGQLAVKNQAVITAQKGGAQNAQQLIFPNTATSNADAAIPSASPPQPTQQNPFDGTFDENVAVPGEDPSYDTKAKQNKASSQFLTYPLTMDNDQDRMVFERWTYSPKSLNDQTTQYAYLGTKISTIILPIQSGISDTNSVEWGGSNLNSIELFAAGAAMELMNENTKFSEVAAANIDEAYKKFIKENPGMYKYYIAQEAVGVQGLLSRASGSVLNPNLSLLFNGPSLRPFSFTFRLTPRSKDEGRSVRSIIRQFKEGSAVNTASTNVFLKAPDVFTIEYQYKQNTSNSLNRFKTCALTSVSVNYTPDGTYMTYQDGTMTSYEMTLTFNELDPIYQSDYKDLPADAIGF